MNARADLVEVPIVSNVAARLQRRHDGSRDLGRGLGYC